MFAKHRAARPVEIEPLILMSASTLEGSNVDDWISGDENDNTILAFGGNDQIHAPIGSNVINGGAGDDTLVVYEGVRANYSLNQLSDGSYLLEGPGLDGRFVSNRLINVESISFNDGRVTLGNGSLSVDTPASQSPVAQPGGDIFGSNGNDWLSGTDGNDDIEAGGGNDSIHAPLGNNVIDGGSGFDTLVVYEGNRSQFQILQQGNGSFEVTGPGLNGQVNTNLLFNIEQIQFNDGALSLQNTSQQFSTPSPQQPSAAIPEPVVQQPVEQPVPQPQSAPEPQPQPEPTLQPVVQTPSFNNSIGAVSEFELEVVRLTNVIRANFGLSQLTLNSELSVAADGHAQSMGNQDYFDHVGLDGRQAWDRALDAGYNYQTIGENIAAGQTTPQEVVDAWFNSPSHRENILNPAFTEIGVGHYFLQNDTGNLNLNHYWTQVLANEQ